MIENNNINGYRDSHQKKGRDYHTLFSENPRRALIWKIEQKILRKIMETFFKERPVHHLDFACGTGRILSFLECFTRSSTGVDVSLSMLEVARNTTRNASLIQADITRNDPLKEKTFNLITAFRFFPNAEVSLRHEALATIKKHLAPDGIFIFNNHKNSLWSGRLLARLITLNRRDGHEQWSPKEVAALLNHHGFEVMVVYHAGILPESENYFFPVRCLPELVEICAMHIPFVRWISHDIIYVCKIKANQSKEYPSNR